VKTSNDDLAKAAGQVDGDKRNPTADVRPPRVAFGRSTMKLSVSGIDLDQKNFFYRWFYEDDKAPGRVRDAEAAYYETVKDAKGKNITRNDKFGRQVLMRLPMEYRQQDLAARKKRLDDSMRTHMKVGHNEYAPTKTSAEGNDSSFVGSERPVENPFA